MRELYGTLERVQGDSVFMWPRYGVDSSLRQVQLTETDTPLAIAVADVERIEAYRFSFLLTAVLVGTLVMLGVLVSQAREGLGS